MLAKLLKRNRQADSIPPVCTQAAENLWNSGIFYFGKAEADNVDHFNPSLVERPDGLWLVVRRAIMGGPVRVGLNSIWAFKLNELDYGPLHGRRVAFPASRPDEQYEDPRAIYNPADGKTWVSCCNFIWYGPSWSGAHQMIAPMLDDWRPQICYHPDYGVNGNALGANKGHEKNWLFFFHDGEMHLLYNAEPWTIVPLNSACSPILERQIVRPDWKVEWKHGQIRGGTPPVRVGDKYWTFFHSSVPWQGKQRRYHIGILAFDAFPPFRPRLITDEPILTGSLNDKWKPGKPPCVFACGALLRNGKWLVSLGVNDLQCAWVEIPHEDVEILASKI